jgi:two-component system response regulator
MPDRKPSILLVEDNPGDAGLVREALEEHATDCELTLVTDGESAIQFIRAIDGQAVPCPNLIILDLNLPRRTGREVLEFMRANSWCSHVPIVILSSSDGRKDREDASRLGATKYIRKPSRLEEFIKLGAVFKGMLAG